MSTINSTESMQSHIQNSQAYIVELIKFDLSAPIKSGAAPKTVQSWTQCEGQAIISISKQNDKLHLNVTSKERSVWSMEFHAPIHKDAQTIATVLYDKTRALGRYSISTTKEQLFRLWFPPDKMSLFQEATIPFLRFSTATRPVSPNKLSEPTPIEPSKKRARLEVENAADIPVPRLVLSEEAASIPKPSDAKQSHRSEDSVTITDDLIVLEAEESTETEHVSYSACEHWPASQLDLQGSSSVDRWGDISGGIRGIYEADDGQLRSYLDHVIVERGFPRLCHRVSEMLGQNHGVFAKVDDDDF